MGKGLSPVDGRLIRCTRQELIWQTPISPPSFPSNYHLHNPHPRARINLSSDY